MDTSSHLFHQQEVSGASLSVSGTHGLVLMATDVAQFIGFPVEEETSFPVEPEPAESVMHCWSSKFLVYGCAGVVSTRAKAGQEFTPVFQHLAASLSESVGFSGFGAVYSSWRFSKRWYHPSGDGVRQFRHRRFSGITPYSPRMERGLPAPRKPAGC